MELRFSSRSSPEVCLYDPISENMPFKSHLNGSIRKTSAFLAPSALPNLSFGDGIFAERTILGSHTKSKLILHTFKGILLANSLIAIYRGQLLNIQELSKFSHVTLLMEQEEFYKNFIDYNDTQVMDVPASLSDFVKYRDSMAHKVRPISIIFL